MKTIEIRLNDELIKYLEWVSKKTGETIQESAEGILMDNIVSDSQYNYELEQELIDGINEGLI